MRAQARAGQRGCPERLLEACNHLDDDCDGATDEGFLDPDGAYTSDEHCGACGNNCTLIVFDGGAGACNTFVDPPVCSVSCSEGCSDVNANPADGCECCDPTPEDHPDPEGVDANCDGVDGERDNAIFVSKEGHDDNSGSWRSPKRTIQAGIDAAADLQRRDVYVATGVYEELLTLRARVAVYGGYSSDFRVRDRLLYEVAILSPPPEGEAAGAVNAVDLQGQPEGSTVFDGFSVYGWDARTPGASSYAVYVAGCDASVRLSYNRIHAGSGGPGGRGQDGDDGASGARGEPGEHALDLLTAYGVPEHDCAAEHHGSGGAGGVSSCSDGAVDTRGGSGGGRVCPRWDARADSTVAPLPQEDGLPGANGAAAGGSAGWDVFHQAYQCVGYVSYGDVEGGEGADGIGGPAGSSGDGCAAAAGGIVEGLWRPAAAADGLAGDHGGGGGGGGSGAGAYVHTSCFSKGYGYDNLGGTGGGAGAGGCAGTPGTAGTGGGGAFGIFVVLAAEAPSAPHIVHNHLYGGVGGPGGDGGNGGTGGSGGAGALGGAGGGLVDPVEPSYPAFKGGKGGNGGDGGHGGGGGGGCGGPAYGIHASDPAAPDLVDWAAGNTFVSPGAGGPGGLGGFSLGHRGGAGALGAAAPTNLPAP